MKPELLTGGGFFWLAVFMTIGLAVNKVRGRPVVNGALVFCWAIVVPTVVLIIAAALRPAASDAVTSWVVGLLLPYLVAFYFARKYSERNAKSKDERLEAVGAHQSPVERHRRSRTLAYVAVALLFVLVAGLLLTSDSIASAIAQLLPLLLVFAVAALLRFVWRFLSARRRARRAGASVEG